MSSTVIPIPDGDGVTPKEKQNKINFRCSPFSILQQWGKHDMQRLTHSIKVGIALVCVSLLYILNPLYQQVGENAMWAIMTVVVVFEFYAGAAATYCRLLPSIKNSYDYGVMIFILTFNLVVVSGLRGEEVVEIARDRLATISMGFSVCIFINFLVFPVWASDKLHHSIASKFEKIASCIEGCLEEHFEHYEKEKQPSTSFSSCKAVLYSKQQDESLVKLSSSCGRTTTTFASL